MKINMVYYAYMMIQLQQYLPFTVLKQKNRMHWSYDQQVATVPTVYGIETLHSNNHYRRFSHVATVLTVYGIETN